MEPAPYWIFGDNILECERAVEVIAASLSEDAVVNRLSGAPYAPRVHVEAGDHRFDLQLFPGHGRWPYDLAAHLKELGAPLREATDAVLVHVSPDEEEADVEPVLAFEFCGALPAGNNAWQRCGRALALARARVPYLYFAELGGVEMDANRVVKASRFPNPLIPFAYLTLGEASQSLAMPVFSRSPSIPEALEGAFEECFGDEEAKAIVRDVLTKVENRAAIKALEEKAVRTVAALADARRRVDTLRDAEWEQVALADPGEARTRVLFERGLTWRKKTSIEVTATFRPLVELALRQGAVAAGATGIPICLLPGPARTEFAKSVALLYEDRVADDFLEWLREERPLVLVWIAGFKPRGDDSRPDRGLMPLARMLLGDKGIDFLAVIYGPGSLGTWRRFDDDLEGLARTNGLWESIVALSDGILVDSRTAEHVRNVGRLIRRKDDSPPAHSRSQRVPLHQAPSEFGEHDVDTILHMLFSSAQSGRLFEGMCNPPGGDWSGLSFQSDVEGDIVRWTSLPRVTAPGSKRPDHVVLLRGAPAIVSAIESKDTAARVEDGIGPRLKAYVDQLFDYAPNITRTTASKAWTAFASDYARPQTTSISGIAFCYHGEDLDAVRARAEADLAIGVEFLRGEERVLLRLSIGADAEAFVEELREVTADFEGRIEVHVD